MALAYLYPNSIVLDNGSFASVGSAPGGKWDAINDIYGLTDDTNYVRCGSGSAPNIRFGLTAMPAAKQINSVLVRARRRMPSGSQSTTTRLAMAATLTVVQNISATYTTSWSTVAGGSVVTTNPDTSQPWTVADMANLIIILLHPNAPVSATADWSWAIIEVDYIPADESIGLPKGVPSSQLRVTRRGLQFFDMRAPLAYGSIPLLEPFRISHHALPTPDGLGASGDRPWSRAEAVLLGRSVDLDTHTVRLKGLLTRDITTRVWDTFVSEEKPNSTGSGPARFSLAGKSMIRTSAAWVESAAAAAQGGMSLSVVAGNSEKMADAGTYIEGVRSNWLLRSFFISGTTGLSLAGTGVNSSAIAADTTDVLADENVSTNSLKFTGGSPIGAADCEAAFPVTNTLPAGSKFRLSIWRKDDSAAAPLAFKVQRGSDSNYWRESDQTWQASETWNYMTGSATWARYTSKVITLSTAASTLTVSLGIPGTTYGGTSVAGQINRVAAAVLEEGVNGGTPIATDTTLVYGLADSVAYSNNFKERSWNRDHGSATIEVIPNWDSADLDSAEQRCILDAYYDASNFDRVLYINGTGWVYRRCRKGVTVSATLAGSVTRGTTYKIGVRWTGVAGERDLAPYTLDIFVDGTKGTAAVSAGIHDPLPQRATLQVGASCAALKPNEMSGNVLWLRADKLTSPDGTAIASWTDDSGNGNNATQASGTLQPTIQTGELNGLPVIRFDGSNDCMDLPNLSLTTSHWFYLVKVGTWTNGDVLLGHVAGGTSAGDVRIQTTTNRFTIRQSGTTFVDLSDASLTTATWYLLEVVQNAAAVQGFREGVFRQTQTVTSVYNTALQLGANGGAATLDCDLAEVIAFNRVLPMHEARRVQHFIAAKYGLSLLGGTHAVAGRYLHGRVRRLDVSDYVPFDEEFT